VTTKRKAKLSGAASRKLRRQRLAKTQNTASTLIKMPYVGKLATVSDWHTQVARIYRRMLIGEIPEYVGTKLVYVATAGASLAKIIADMRHEESMRIALERAVEAGLIDRNVLPPAFGGEYIGKDDNDTEDDDPMIQRSNKRTTHRSINS
jgi:hypothetical protein